MRRGVYLAILIEVVLLLSWVERGVTQQRVIAPELVQRARAEGKVRVLAQLNPSTQPEGHLQRVAAILAQRNEIATAQSEVMHALVGKRHRVMQRFRTIPFVALEVDSAALSALEQSGQVLEVQEDYLSEPLLAQSTPLVQADQAWEDGVDGSGWTVAILDTGVDRSHPFLAGKVVAEACYSANGSCPNGQTSQLGTGAAVPCTYSSACSHGTHVAGIAAGRSTSHSGVARGANIIAMQVFSRLTGSACGGTSPCALSYTSDQIAALERIYTLRGTYQIAAVNMSLGGGAYTSQATCDAAHGAQKAVIDNLRSVGIATVIASGNNGYVNALSGPGCISSAVSVGSTTKTDTISSFSNSASFLSLLAPGGAIQSSVPGTGFASFSGTSMATPHVAGAWAILKQQAPGASVNEVLNALQNTGRPVTDPGNGLTKRRIQIAQALSELTQSQYRLTVTLAGSGSGTVTSTPARINCGSTCTASFAEGQTITLQAVASSGSSFTGWEGACSGTGACTLSLTQARSVTATFTQPRQTLTVTPAGTGSGTVSSTPAGLSCGSTCAAAFVQGQTITLSAVAASGSTFTGWSGACAGTGVCKVSMTQARNVTATFTQIIRPLTVRTAGTGSGTVTSAPVGINCPGTCQTSLPQGQAITLQAVAASGSTFTGWSGACSGTGVCTLSLTQARNVTATFTKLLYPLTVTKDGTGSGKVTSTPAKLNCGAACTVSFAHGQTITLSAVPTSGSLFAGWQGACSGTGTCTLNLTQAASVTATFTRIMQPLHVILAGTGRGQVTSTPAGISCGQACTGSFPQGPTVTLSAAVGSGSTFTGWSGACTGKAVCQVSMTQAHNVTATFQ